MMIDQTFLKPHWRTVQWLVEKEQCKRCKHMNDRPTKRGPGQNGSGSGGGMYCTAIAAGKTPFGDNSCISTREKSCGPGAKLFEAK
jgi:hypothetical protein